MKSIFLATACALIIVVAGFSSVASARESISIQKLREKIKDGKWYPGYIILWMFVIIFEFLSILYAFYKLYRTASIPMS